MLIKKKILKKITIQESSKIIDVIQNLNFSGLKIVLVTDKKNNFIGIINDGDIRRALLKGLNINDKILRIVNRKCLISNNAENNEEKNNILKKNSINHIPIIKKRKILGLYIQSNNTNLPIKKINNDVIIMAGGFGRRLGHLTKKMPKALLKFKEKPLLQHVIENAKNSGFNKFTISIFYLKKLIKNFFRDKKNLSTNISYIEEKKPLGTIGSIKLIKKISENFIVINCDVITNVDLHELLKFHKKKNAMITIGVKHFKYQNPYGVIISKNSKFISFQEKPEINFNINAGIYVFNKKIISIIKKENLKNIEDLINYLNRKNKKILTFPIFENWKDLGQDKKDLKRFN